MGTKLDPGKYDCLANAKPDEPYFCVLARDPQAAELVRNWAWGRTALIKAGVKPASDRAQVLEALECANRMEIWRQANRG